MFGNGYKRQVNSRHWIDLQLHEPSFPFWERSDDHYKMPYCASIETEYDEKEGLMFNQITNEWDDHTDNLFYYNSRNIDNMHSPFMSNGDKIKAWFSFYTKKDRDEFVEMFEKYDPEKVN